MLYALGHPASFAVLLASFVLGVLLHGWAQGIVAVRMGDTGATLARRNRPEPQVHVDPFGAVGALIGGVGWAQPIELGPRRDRARVVAVALVGPAVNLALGIGLLLLWRASLSSGTSAGYAAVWGSGGTADLGGLGVPVTAGSALQHGLSFAGDALGGAVLLAGVSQLYLGVLSLVPLPPLDGGRLLFALSPQTLGWQRARHYLVEQNVGLVIVLVMLAVPLGGRLLLLYVLDQLLAPLLRVLLGV